MTDKEANIWEDLISRYFANTISREQLDRMLEKVQKEEEIELLMVLLHEHWEKAKIENDATNVNWDARYERMMQEVIMLNPESGAGKKRKWLRPYQVAAAVLVLLLGVAGYFIHLRTIAEESDFVIAPVLLENDLPPGSRGAVLILANGGHIVLDSAENGMLVMQGKTKVINQDGRLVYNYNMDTSAQQEFLYNTMQTPRGRQYQLMLSDGTKVWLNASSSIRYPIAFASDKRKVEIVGEAYFEVAPLYAEDGEGKIPFIVEVNAGSAGKSEIEVLGTRFNVNAYSDEEHTKTTLLEGSVRIKQNDQSRTLVPGQQALISNPDSGEGNIVVDDGVDVNAVMAWKNGFFSFGNTSLPAIFRQLSRWYDVEVSYTTQLPDRKFGGEISRGLNLSEVLRILEKSKVYCRIEGKRVIVMPDGTP